MFCWLWSQWFYSCASIALLGVLQSFINSCTTVLHWLLRLSPPGSFHTSLSKTACGKYWSPAVGNWESKDFKSKTQEAFGTLGLMNYIFPEFFVVSLKKTINGNGKNFFLTY